MHGAHFYYYFADIIANYRKKFWTTWRQSFVCKIKSVFVLCRNNASFSFYNHLIIQYANVIYISLQTNTSIRHLLKWRKTCVETVVIGRIATAPFILLNSRIRKPKFRVHDQSLVSGNHGMVGIELIGILRFDELCLKKGKSLKQL